MIRSRKMMLASLALAVFTMPLAAHADQGRGYPRQFPDERLREQSVAGPAAVPNRVSIAQQGRGNGAGVLQTGSGNTAGILQFGQGNTGVITQEDQETRRASSRRDAISTDPSSRWAKTKAMACCKTAGALKWYRFSCAQPIRHGRI